MAMAPASKLAGSKDQNVRKAFRPPCTNRCRHK